MSLVLHWWLKARKMFVCKYEIGPVLKEYLVHKIKIKIIYKLVDLGKHSTLVKNGREMLFHV